METRISSIQLSGDIDSALNVVGADSCVIVTKDSEEVAVLLSVERYRQLSPSLPVVLERDESGMFIAECPSLPGCVSEGETEQEALRNIEEAAVACMEVRREQGWPISLHSIRVPLARVA